MNALICLILAVLGCAAFVAALPLCDRVCLFLLKQLHDRVRPLLLKLLHDRVRPFLLEQLRRRIRPFLRKYRNWERLSLMLLTLSLLSVLILSWFGAAGDPNSETPWFFQGIRVTFEVFECDSGTFRSYGGPFVWLYGILACAVPLLTVSTALGLLWEHLPHHVPIACPVWHIFSEADANSIRMAKNLSREDHLCIFLRTRRSKLDEDVLTELQEVNYFLYPKEEIRFMRWRRRRSRTLRFYFLSENTDENFERMQDFLTAIPDKSLFEPVGNSTNDSFQQELYLLSETESAPMLIEHLRKGLEGKPCFRNTELRLLDRFRATSYDLLRTKPLYDYSDGKTLNVLVLGFGRIGREFFRAACSLGVLHDCKTEFTLCDLEIGTKLSLFLSQCPELDRSVSFRSRCLNADTADLEDLVAVRDYHYILVALGDDERNIRVASRLKRHYRLRHWKYLDGQLADDIQPQICVNIEDPIKHDYTEKLWAQKLKWERPLHVFGGLDQVFTETVLMPRQLWQAAWYIHSTLSPSSHTWSEYERRSSIACAAHAACYLKIPNIDLKKITANWSPEDPLCSSLTDTEHRRWMAYVRSEGLRWVSPEVMAQYYPDQNVEGGHVDVLGKLTPCLVETKEELNKVWDFLMKKDSDTYKGKLSFRERDEFIVKHAHIIAKLAPPPTHDP